MVEISGQIDPYGNVEQDDQIPVFVIVLDRSYPRAEPLLNQLKDSNVEYTKISAMDGFEITFAEVNSGNSYKGVEIKKGTQHLKEGTKYLIDCRYDDKNFPYGYEPHSYFYTYSGGWPGGPGASGLKCANMYIYEKIIKENLKYALIFEEDAQLLPPFSKDYLQNAIKSLPDDWGALYLDINFYSHSKTSQDNKYVIKVDTNRSELKGSQALIITYKTAKIMLDIFKDHENCCLDNLYTIAAKEMGVKVYRTKDELVDVDWVHNTEINKMDF